MYKYTKCAMDQFNRVKIDTEAVITALKRNLANAEYEKMRDTIGVRNSQSQYPVSDVNTRDTIDVMCNHIKYTLGYQVLLRDVSSKIHTFIQAQSEALARITEYTYDTAISAASLNADIMRAHKHLTELDKLNMDLQEIFNEINANMTKYLLQPINAQIANYIGVARKMTKESSALLAALVSKITDDVTSEEGGAELS